PPSSTLFPYTTLFRSTFDKAMAAGLNFAITCVAPCVNPTGTVALSAGSTVGTYTLTSSTSLAPLTDYTVTANAPMSAGGLPLVRSEEHTSELQSQSNL